MNHFIKICLLLFLFSTCDNVQGQIVNIENNRLSAKKEGLGGSADFHLNYTLNTKSLLQVGNRLKLAYSKNKHYLLLLTDQSLVKSGEDAFINRGFEHLRYNYTFKDSGKVVFEAF